MEGPRLPRPPSTIHEDDKPDDPSSAFHRPTSSLPDLLSGSGSPSSSHWRQNSLNFLPSPTPPHDPPPEPIPEVETYVVQAPKDQVYWVPPPEHANIAQQRRKPERKKKGGRCKRLAWFSIILVVLGIIMGFVGLIVNFVFRPVQPIFNVYKFAVKSNQSHVVSYGITIRAENPTSNMGVEYTEGDIVSISYEGKNIGSGKFPKLTQSAYGSDPVHLKLDASKNAALPKSKQSVKLILSADLKAEYGVGPLRWKEEVTVTCNVNVKDLNDHIESQRCETEFILKK
ncbi:PREDICTED: uncharacterized protein LOC104804156 [Tarenaya hassleriana]|uniref:uncharacterized protein LOC104804156 n=1 Tax=Tarenaya hassleriana TaxID=28532 RepID=UPI00053C82D8|nr:PREDICTED: uncharacterized protein LOC104804156 [Tarenaya hassleriana]